MVAKAKFVVQPFRYDGKRLIAGTQMLASGEEDAVRKAEAMSNRPAVIAFEVENDEEADVYGEPRIFFRSGIAAEEDAA
mgnify:CR=1 FL=1